MKIILTFLLLFIPAFAGDSAKDVSSAIETWKTAMLKGDAATLDKLYHKDLVYTHSSGKTETKAESIAAATKPGSIEKSIELSGITTRVYGKTAIVKCQGVFVGQTGPGNHLDLLMVWLETPQGWQLVARQATKLP
jgi:ketosteroid isomerase-like protein